MSCDATMAAVAPSISAAESFQPPEDGDAAEAARDENADMANAVSVLQEYIQSCSSFSPHTKILTWSFDQQLENDTSLQFRATVSFVFGDVPHHFSGGWQTSKKKAQRDTAERVRHYLSRREDSGMADKATHAAMDVTSLPEQVIDKLQKIRQDGGKDDVADGMFRWRIEDRKSQASDEEAPTTSATEYRATVTISIQGVPHHFCGSWADSEEASRMDTVERSLWYFNQSDDQYMAVEQAPPGAVAAAGPPQSMNQVPGSTARAAAAVSATDDKTILMQVQNALQKAFAKDTPPGQRVWVWEYEADPHDPQLFRARVKVPSWSKTFEGNWCRGKKLAQRSACLMVKTDLDERTQDMS